MRFVHGAAALSAAVALAGVATASKAATAIGDSLTIGGFGTLGGVATNTDDAQFGRDRQVGGATKTPALDVDSNLGVQLDAKATHWLSGTVQVLTQKREWSAVSTRIDWAYVLVKPVDGLAIRGGRMATPAFLVSDSRDIGYANNWLRAPNEVYGLNYFRTVEGADVSYRRSIGPVSATLTGLAGRSPFRSGRVTGAANAMRGVSLVVETEWVTARAGRLTADVSVPSINSFGDPYVFRSYGATVDRGNIFAQAEFVTRRATHESPSVDANGWYVMGGYRFGPVLPYAIFSRGAPQNLDSPFHLQNTQRTTALGVRWDAASSIDVKFQVERIDTNGTTGISFTTPVVRTNRPGPPPNLPVTGTVTALSLALDFTF